MVRSEYPSPPHFRPVGDGLIALCEEENVTSQKCQVKWRVCEVLLGQRGGSSYGEGGRGMRSCGPSNSQILGPTGIGFRLSVIVWQNFTKKNGLT